jgi:uncharacterized iron-regulated membrane protein
MNFRKLIGKLHLWLGFTSGLVVFIVAITGCIYAFQEEIQDLTQPYRYVQAQESAMLPPSRIVEITDAQMSGKHPHSVTYSKDKSRAAEVVYFSFEEKYYDKVYVNQYTGEINKIKNVHEDFFRIVLMGHFYLWLPDEIGRPIVASATLIFIVMLISGIILWWPKNKGAVKQRFSIKWSGKWRRKNYDLHSVMGFYISWLVLVLAITGLVWGFDWFSQMIFSATGGGEVVEYYEPASDTSNVASFDKPTIDIVWEKMKAEYPAAEEIEVHIPETPFTSIAANANPDASTYWQTDYRYFDQYNLNELSVTHQWNRLEDSNFAETLRRMNYDIHVGAILGFPGKLLAFFLSLITASLPVTGFLMWYGRKKKTVKAEKEKSIYQPVLAEEMVA